MFITNKTHIPTHPETQHYIPGLCKFWNHNEKCKKLYDTRSPTW